MGSFRGRKLRITGSAGLLIVAGIFLFVRLGHYAPWDDEATTLLHAQSVWEHGEAYIARGGGNIVAYQNGILAKDGINMADPPLQFYLAAPFVGLGGGGTFIGRLPFALCGLATIGLILWWLDRDCDDDVTFILFIIAFTTCTVLWLYFRQARYYAPAILLSTLSAYLYLHYDGRRKLIGLGVSLALLLLTHYLLFIAVCACISIDYLVWQRRETPLKWRDWLIVLAAPILAAMYIAIFRFPPASATAATHQGGNTVGQKLLLFLYELRDMNTDELMPVILLPVALLIAVRNDARPLRRLLVCFFGYIVVIAAVAPTSVAKSAQAETRYLSPLIPVCLAIVVLTIRQIMRRAPVAGWTLAVMAFGTTLLHLLIPSRHTNLFATPARSTILSFPRELIAPPGDPFVPTAKWMNANMKPGQSIAAFPLHMEYPLMFLKPDVVYGWQLDAKQPPPLANLPEIHFRGGAAPDYVIFFGRHEGMVKDVDARLAGVAEYEPAATLKASANVNHRPEISWHCFSQREYDPKTESIVIWRRKDLK